MKKTLITLLSYLFITSFLFSQERVILRTNGEQIKLAHKKDLREAIKETKIRRSDGTISKSNFVNSKNNNFGLSDTMNYRDVGGSWNTNFGFFSQEVILTWFEAPADMTIEGIGFTCIDDSGYLEDGVIVGLRLVKLNWTREQLQNFSEAAMQGHYPSEGNGYNNIDAFGEMATGNWISNDENNPLPPWTNHENPDSNSFDYDLWSDDGGYWPVVPVVPESSDPVYNWLDLTSTGVPAPYVKNKEVFAVVAMNNGISAGSSRIGFYADNTINYPAWKFYQYGRTAPDVDQGWWVRKFTFDFAIAVDIVSPPYIYIQITKLTTTLSTEASEVEATIIDSNPSGGESVIAELNLIYTINDGDEISVLMTGSGDIYTAQIPGQSPGTIVTYYVKGTDVGGNERTSRNTYTYKIFLVTDDNNLLVFNGQNAPIDLPGMTYPQSYYWGNDSSLSAEWTYDAWAYGPLTKELVDNYHSIFEICTDGPLAYNREIISEWLSADGSRNYLLAGDEWLGADNGYTDQDYVAGSFEYDILGVSHSYNDVSYDGTSGQELASKFMPIEGSQIGGAMSAKVAALQTDSTSIDSVLYDPIGEISAASNWHDGFDASADAEVFMMGETRGILGTPAVRSVNTGVSNVTANGNKIVFMTYDPISINSTPTNYWLGRGNQSNTYQAMEWFQTILLDIKKDGVFLEEYSLLQNYPNPFNPSTTIKYSIPNSSVIASGAKQSNEIATSSDDAWTPRTDNATLKIYNILGQEIATLVNKKQKAGSYEVKFDASNLTSGIYFYRLQSGGFVESRKMILVK